MLCGRSNICEVCGVFRSTAGGSLIEAGCCFCPAAIGSSPAGAGPCTGVIYSIYRPRTSLSLLPNLVLSNTPQHSFAEKILLIMSDAEQDDFSRKSSILVKWLRERGTIVNPKISVADLRNKNAGRGVGIILSFCSLQDSQTDSAIVAIDDIGEGEELFSLELADVLSAETSELRRLIPKELQKLDEWLSLVLVLIYEYGQGERSSWRPYLDILPTQFDTLAFWTPQELAELQGSAVMNKIGTHEADRTFSTELLPLVKAHSDVFGGYASAFRGPDAESVLLGLAHRMATLIMAYAFDLEIEQPDVESEDMDLSEYVLPKGMIPLADMLNADGDKNNVSERDISHVYKCDGQG